MAGAPGEGLAPARGQVATPGRAPRATAELRSTLSFDVNPDGFLCEGTPVLDGSGDATYEPTTFLNEAGQVESKLACEQAPGAAARIPPRRRSAARIARISAWRKDACAWVCRRRLGSRPLPLDGARESSRRAG